MIRIKSRRDIVAWLRDAASVPFPVEMTPGELLSEIEKRVTCAATAASPPFPSPHHVVNLMFQDVAMIAAEFAVRMGIATRDELTAEAERTNQTKGRDYTGDGDILRNFYRVAERVNISPLQVVAVYVLKHLDALDTFVATGKLASSETAASRVMDIFLYAALAAAICQREAAK